MKTLMNLHLLKSPESEKHVFRGWSVCMCFNTSVRVREREVGKLVGRKEGWI